MIYFIQGDDTLKIKSAISNIEKKYKGYKKLSFDKDDFEESVFLQEVTGRELFENNNKIFFLYYLYENQKEKDFVDNKLFELSNESDVFVILTKEKDITYKGELSTFNCFEDAKKMDFSLWRAIQERNKKEAWLSFVKQKTHEPIQLIQASLLSQFKKIYITKVSQNISFKDLGFSTEKAYVNSISASKKYSKEELEDYIYQLTKIQTEGVKGENTEAMIEKFLLKL